MSAIGTGLGSAPLDGAPLTPEQREIVESGDGPVVVIAGAGTGKTRVIVERVRWLLETKGAGTRDANSATPCHAGVWTR